jgi:hypothetical protein
MIYGVDSVGNYLGVVPVTQSAGAATVPPPMSGAWRWNGTQWAAHKSVEEQLMDIESQRDQMLQAGVPLNGKSWYTDQVFQQQIAAYLQAYTEGLLAATALSPVRSMDGVVNMLTRDQIRQLAGAVMTFVQGVWAWSWTAKAAVRA